jgi:hypothetical protein
MAIHYTSRSPSRHVMATLSVNGWNILKKVNNNGPNLVQFDKRIFEYF